VFLWKASDETCRTALTKRSTNLALGLVRGTCGGAVAKNRKVAGLFADGVIGIFPSGRTMALGSIQLVTEMSTRNISCG
jgi:hypothetical protein